MRIRDRKHFENSRGEVREQLSPERHGRLFPDVSSADLHRKCRPRFDKVKARDVILLVVGESKDLVRAWFRMVAFYEGTGVEEIICHLTVLSLLDDYVRHRTGDGGQLPLDFR